MEKALIVAKAMNDVIGYRGQLPWHLPEDLRFFKQITRGHTVIMGRKTYLSIGRPLPNRDNIILSRDPGYIAPQGCVQCTSLAGAFQQAAERGAAKVFVIGGAEVYKAALPWLTTLYITEVATRIAGDTFFPKVDWEQWREVSREEHDADARHAYGYTFVRFQRVDTGEQAVD